MVRRNAGSNDVRRWAGWAAGFGVVTIVSGCAQYHARPIDAARSARQLTSRTLDDPRLQRFLAAVGEPAGHRWGLRSLTLAAVYERPDLKIAAADYEIATGSVVTAQALPNPTLSISPTYNATNGNPSPLKIGPIVSFLLGSLGARQAGIAAARDRVAAARQVVATAAWLVRARVRDALLGLWSAQAQRGLVDRNASYARGVADAVDQRFRAGMVASVIDAQSRLAAEQASFAVAQAARRVAVARASLAAAVGVPMRALSSVPISTAAFDHPPQPGAIGDMTRQALTHRPSVVAALARYQASQQDLRAAIDSQFPGVTIGPGYHYDQGDSKYILALSLPLPIFNQNQGPIAVARARRRLAAARLMAAQLHVLDQIDAADARYQTSLAETHTADRIAAEASSQVQAARSAYRAGATGRLRLLAAEQALVVARQNRLTAAIQRRTALGLLEDGLHRRFYGAPS